MVQVFVTIGIALLLVLARPAFCQKNCFKCAREHLQLLNRYRNSLGKPSLTWSDGLSQAAATHSAEMYARNSVQHSKIDLPENIAGG